MGNVDLRHLRYFAAVADAGSVSAAARTRLNTAQPSLSRQIRDLEAELGVALFERRVRGVALTRPGRLFLGHVRQILKQLDGAIAAVRDAPLLIRLGIIPGLETFVLPDFTRLARAAASGMDVEVEVEVTSAASTSLVEDLKDGNLDVAFARPSETDLDLHFEPIGEHRIAVFVRATHPLAARPAVRFADLAGHAYIAINRRVAPFLRGAIDRWGQQHGLALVPTHVSSDIASAFSLILASDGGFSLMPDYAGRLMPATLAMRPLADAPPPLLLTIAYRPLERSPTQAVVSALARQWPREAKPRSSGPDAP